jgi:menaquinone-9 beta-reductase
MTEPDLFVIGGGPAGLAAAIAARRRGLNVVVADAAFPPIDKACGEGIMPDGLVAARALGLDLDKAGQPFRGIRFAGAGRSVEAAFPHGRGMGIRRTALHDLMVGRAAALGVRFRWGTAVHGLEDIRARWIVGADGAHSRVRQWAGLDDGGRHPRRYGFRRHYRVARQSEFMEVHWGRSAQLYLTPVAPAEVCAVLISRHPQPRLEQALAQFPEAAARLCEPLTSERGSLTISRRFPAVWRGNLALVGDASGSVDAITGEGLCLLFQQAEALGEALAAGHLARYGDAHRRIGRIPQFMARFMLLLDGRDRIRARVLQAMAARPPLFARMLAMHVGEASALDFVKNSLALGWEMVTSL